MRRGLQKSLGFRQCEIHLDAGWSPPVDVRFLFFRLENRKKCFFEREEKEEGDLCVFATLLVLPIFLGVAWLL